MEETRQRLQWELNHAMERIRQLGGAVLLEELAGGAGDNMPPADELDVSSLSEAREMSFATRSMLVERANQLAEALDRVRDGEYGVCMECGAPIAPARLRVMPEVATCVRCQDRLERTRRLEGVAAGVGGDEFEDERRTPGRLGRTMSKRRRGRLQRQHADDDGRRGAVAER